MIANKSVRFLTESIACMHSPFKWNNYEETWIITDYLHVNGT